ncbi:hypothetical protein [Pseudomonas sp. NPDC096950]|uniref:hypothetical protein n=1 Tax=Pseudomonas sp. NPDC096950 TaxID=3364485 RepID=UPI003839DDCD
MNKAFLMAALLLGLHGVVQADEPVSAPIGKDASTSSLIDFCQQLKTGDLSTGRIYSLTTIAKRSPSATESVDAALKEGKLTAESRSRICDSIQGS